LQIWAGTNRRDGWLRGGFTLAYVALNLWRVRQTLDEFKRMERFNPDKSWTPVAEEND
jgi:hypothetical protein